MQKILIFISYLLFPFFIGLISSCVPYKNIDIQYLNKTEIKLPKTFNKVLILANTNKPFDNSKRIKFEYSLDSVAVHEASTALQDQLYSSPWFDNQSIPISYFERTDSSKYIKPLNWNTLNQIASKDSADLIISIEYLKLKPEYENFQRWNGESVFYYGYLKYSIYVYWRIYDLQVKKIVDGNLYTDTLIWDASDWTPVLVGSQLPGYFSCAAYAGYQAGELYSKKIAPIWNDDIRLMFISGPMEMKRAADFAEKGDWIEAANEWQKVINTNKGKVAARAAYNLALANEMLGHFSYSLEWLNKAKKLYPLGEIEEYKSIIESRLDK